VHTKLVFVDDFVDVDETWMKDETTSKIRDTQLNDQQKAWPL
jgi:hypothetical protein